MENWLKKRDELVKEFESKKSNLIFPAIFIIALFSVLGLFCANQSFFGYLEGFFHTIGYGLIVFGFGMAYFSYNADCTSIDSEIKKLRNIHTKEEFDDYVLKAKLRAGAVKILLKVLGHMG